jgi:hypothetical protein
MATTFGMLISFIIKSIRLLANSGIKEVA